ncbi:hypothetical protein [Erwinia sp. OLFS4]|nr:hypothetical protein [Erwinia sp. OLFS4]
MQKEVDLSYRLLYNLATPRYDKVFSQNFAAPATLPEGVGLLDKMVV